MSLTGLLFVMCFAVGCLLAFARHPIFGLVTYVAAFYLSPPDRWWGQGWMADVRWSLLAGVIALLAVWASGDRTRRPPTPFLRQSIVVGFLIFVAWVAVQSLWALDPEMHSLLLETYVKFLVAMYLIYRCVDSEQNLRLFLWSHVLGCVYLGWLVYSSHEGGRYEGFGGSGIGEANAGALQLVTGAVVAGALFLAGSARARIVLLGFMPFIVNGIVATISRSGFLAMAAAGIVFNLFPPKRLRLRVLILSALGGLLLILLTNPTYWTRMQTIKYAGEEVQGIDTGAGRRETFLAQIEMFKQYPLGCGHMCTTVLSPGYLDEQFLSGGARASHNTFMTALVDHGVPGGIFYLLLATSVFSTVRKLRRQLPWGQGFLASCLAASASSLAAIFVADLFVQYPRFEARWWFVAILMVLTGLRPTSAEPQSPESPSGADVPLRRP